ncbi:MAG: DUF1622 domain-containing protein [Myxococcota bacterium]
MSGVDFSVVVELCAKGIDAVGVAVLVLGVSFASVRYVVAWRAADAFRQYRRRLGETLLLGLEILVAADILDTVGIGARPTREAMLSLAGIVVIRTFLSFSVDIELQGRLPWRATQPRRTDAP